MSPKNQSTLKELQDHLRFESLLNEISARFINLPPDQVDHEIEEAQRLVCECLGLDLSSLWQWPGEAPGSLRMTHLYRALGGPPTPEPFDAQECFPWCLQQVMAGKVIVVPSMEELPPEAARDREMWRYFGIKTALTIPLAAGDEPTFGALGFNTVRAERAWSDEIVNRVRLVAQIFANAIARKRADQALRESVTRMNLAADSAGAGLWDLEVDTGLVWVSARARELFGFAPDGGLTYEHFLKAIHPEDREAVEHLLQRSIQGTEDFRSEHRINLPDGGVRWIGSRGRFHPQTSSKTARLMGASLDISNRKEMEISLRNSYDEIKQLKDRLEAENVYLRQETCVENTFEHIIGQSESLRHVLHQIEQVASSDAVIFIFGETGTGKELIAEAIHDRSKRKERLLVKVNCAALPAALVENELFGREKGAYTGALSRQIGRFELADHSTLFLDEIAELPLDVQAKLLRVLQSGEFERLGSPKTIRVDVRLIAATNRDIAAEVQRGAFRKDLYYRLNVFPIFVPPLRERTEDIPLLVQTFVREFSGKMGKRVQIVPSKTMDALQRYQWPGNIRELRNVIEHAVIVSAGNVLNVQVPQGPEDNTSTALTMEAVEYQHIMDMLKATGWRIKGPRGAATLLGMKPSTLYAKMDRLGIPTRSEKDRGAT